MPAWLVTCGVAAMVFVLLCAVLVVVAYFWLGLHRTNQVAEIVPADTSLVISLSPDPRQALHFRDAQDLETMFPMFGAVPALREAGEQAQADLAAEFDIDFRQDLLPWIGREVSLAIVDVEPGGYHEVPPLVLAVATRSEARSYAFVDKVRRAMEREGTPFANETYRDVSIIYAVPQREGEFAPAFASFDGLLVVGSELDTLHQAIDRAAGDAGPVLADQEAFHDVLAALPANRLGYFYLDGRILRDDADGGLATATSFLRGVGASFRLVGDGLAIDYVLSNDIDRLTDEERQGMQRRSNRLHTVERLPGSSIAFFSGQDLYAAMRPALLWTEDSEDFHEAMDDIAYEIGVHPIDDLLAHLSGEVTFALLPDPAGLPGEDVPFGLLFLAEIENPDDLAYSLQTLVQFLEYEGDISVSDQNVEGLTFTFLRDPWDAFNIGYTLDGDLLVIGSSLAVLRAFARGQDTLMDQDLCRDVIDHLAGDASDYLYVDAQELIRALYRTMGESQRRDFDEEARPYLGSVSAIGLAVEPLDRNGMLHGSFLIYTTSE
jgi:hypothetical protein